jgi:hypothetical protein
MTGATGSLTPSDADEEFVPAETREISDPAAARRITVDAHRRAEDRGAGNPDSAEGPPVTDEHQASQTRSGGYGSGSGLSAEDPAYRLEEKAPPAGATHRPPDAPTVLGGDERRDPEDEHL